jgi:hypothetical protein
MDEGGLGRRISNPDIGFVRGERPDGVDFRRGGGATGALVALRRRGASVELIAKKV